MKTSKFNFYLLAVALFAGGIVTPLAVVMPGCSKRGADMPIVFHGVTLTNGCLADAIECSNKVGPKAEPRILLIRYQAGGIGYGHAMTVFRWPDDGSIYTVWYAYDAKNSAFPLPAKIDHSNPLAVAKFMIPPTTSAWFTEPNPTPTP